jgi:hypothetical protein
LKGESGLSPQLLLQPRQTIKECVESHIECRRGVNARLPRRVIDVGYSEACLYETRGGETPYYATLTHCWENSQPLTTTKANYNYRLGRLVWNELPIAFQEAIQIVRDLGLRYLWIDSLCIIQDNHEDWEIEAARMASIYENSYVTLALHQNQPNSPSLSLLTSNFSFRFKSKSRLSPIWMATCQSRRLTSDDESDLDKSPLYERAWCFQVLESR